MITCLYCKNARKHMRLDALGRCDACAAACRYPSRPAERPLRGVGDAWNTPTGKKLKIVHDGGDE